MAQPIQESENTTSTLRLPAEPVLIVEDTKQSQELLVQLCAELGVTAQVADNGEEALAKIHQHSYSLFIVDLMMPKMDGATFIPKLKKMMPESVIIVQTAVSTADRIIEIMNMGVYDYIIKPLDPDLFFNIITKALEFKYLKELETLTQIQSGSQVKQEMDWLLYKERRTRSDKENAEIKSVSNLKTSISQGGGFGTILTIFNLIQRNLTEYKDHYLIPKEFINLLLDNKSIIENHVYGLQVTSDLLENEIPLEKKSSAELLGNLENYLQDIFPYLQAKKLHLTLPHLKQNYPLYYNEKAVGLLIEELVINAYKYSPRESSINILAHVNNGYLSLSVKNDVSKQGILNKEQEKLVKEPFYRIMPPDETVAKVEKFSLGLGLTVADNIMNKHEGLFSIRTMVDHIGNQQSDAVMAELMFPLAK